MKMLRGLLILGFILGVSSNPSDRCPAVDGPDSVYFPDETDCTRFYQCSNGFAYLRQCPANLNWDPKRKVCVWPEDYSCTNAKCPPVDGPDSVYFPDKTNCTRFYHCSNGVAYLHDCPAGLNWDPKLQVCVWPRDYSCSDSPKVVPPFSPDVSGQCPAVDGPDSVYFPDETDCSRFYQCSNGVAYLRECPAHLNWDPRIQVCVWPEDYTCPKPECPAVDGPNSVYFADKRNCSRFYQCSNGVAYLMDCPAGLNWDPKIQVCVWPKDYSCSSRFVSSLSSAKPVCSAADSAEAAYVPATFNFGQFYECSYEGAHLKDCSAGLVWNQEIQACEYQPNRPFSWESKDVQCPIANAEQSTYLRDTTDCGRFFQCIKGIAYRRRCPYAQVWNSISETCVSAKEYTC